MRVACHAGTSPKRIPVASETPTVKAMTRPLKSTCIPFVFQDFEMRWGIRLRPK